MPPAPGRPSGAARPRPPTAEPSVAPYRPLGWRRRFAIAGLAVATAIAVVWLLLDPPGGVQRKRAAAPAQPAAAAPETCTEVRTERCVGGKVEVIVVPRPPAER